MSKHELWSTFLQILSSTFLCVFVCMYICVQQVRSFPFSLSTLPLSIFLSMHLSYYLSLGLSIYLSFYMSIFLSIHLSFYRSIFSFNSPHVVHFTFLPRSLSTFSTQSFSSTIISFFHFILIFSILFSSFPFSFFSFFLF